MAEDKLALQRELTPDFEYGISTSESASGVVGPVDSPIFSDFNGNDFVHNTLYYLWWRLRGSEWAEQQRDPIVYQNPDSAKETLQTVTERDNKTTKEVIVLNDLTAKRAFVTEPSVSVNADNKLFVVWDQKTLEFGVAPKVIAQDVLDFEGVLPDPDNQAPESAALTNQTGTIGAPFTYTIPLASDPEGAPLQYSVSNLPPGLFFNSGTRVIVGKPTQAGTYTVTLITTDPGGLSDTDTFSITIGAPAHSLIWNSISYNPANGVCTLSVTSSISTTTYPVTYRSPGITAGQSSPVLPAVPTYQRNGVTFSVFAEQTGPDGTVITIQGSFTTYVTETANTAPVMPTVSIIYATVGVAFSQQLPAGTDADNDPLNYQVIGTLPSGVTFGANRVLSGTPTQAGSYSLVYSGNDGKAPSVTTPFTLVVANATVPSIVRVDARFLYRSVTTNNSGISIGGSTGAFLSHIILVNAQSVPAGGKVQIGIQILNSGAPSPTGYTWVDAYSGTPPQGFTHYQGNETGPIYVGGGTYYAVRIIDGNGNVQSGPILIYSRDNGVATEMGDYAQFYPAVTGSVNDPTTLLTVANPDPANPIFVPKITWVTGPDGRQWARITNQLTPTASHGWLYAANGHRLASGSLGTAATYPPYTLVTLDMMDAAGWDPINDAGFYTKAQLIVRLGDSAGTTQTQYL